MEFLNSRDIKHLIAMIEKQWAAKFEFKGLVCRNNEGRLFLVSEKYSELDTRGLRIESIGLYIGRLVHAELKLSIEGSQLIGPYAKQNVVELSDEEFYDWMRGLDIKRPEASKVFLIVKNKKEYFGCARHNQGKLLNLFPKERRIRSFT